MNKKYMRFYIVLVVGILLMTMTFFGCEKAENKEPQVKELPFYYSINDAKRDGYVVHEEGNITYGNEVWELFLAKVNKKETATVRIANIYTAHLSSNKEPQQVFYVDELSYDGREYTISSIGDSDRTSKNYKYLMKYIEEPESQSARHDSCIMYVLTNDNKVTWDDIWQGMISSQSDAGIDHWTVYTDYVYEDKKWYQTDMLIRANLQYTYEESITENEKAGLVFDNEIPEDELRNMPTETLADAVLTCSNFGLAYISSDSNFDGYRYVYDSFNGCNELFNREDAGKVLLDIYTQLDHDEMEETDEFYSLRLFFLEHMLGEEEILNKLSEEERKMLSDCAKKYLKLREEMYTSTFSYVEIIRLIKNIALIDDEDFIKYAQEHDLDNSVTVEEYDKMLELLLK